MGPLIFPIAKLPFLLILQCTALKLHYIPTVAVVDEMSFVRSVVKLVVLSSWPVTESFKTTRTSIFTRRQTRYSTCRCCKSKQTNSITQGTRSTIYGTRYLSNCSAICCLRPLLNTFLIRSRPWRYINSFTYLLTLNRWRSTGVQI